MSIVIDLMVLAIIIITAFISAKYGFVRTVVEVVGLIAIIIFINSTSVKVAEKIYDDVIDPKIVTATSSIGDNATGTVDKAFEVLPKFITKDNNIFGIKKSVILDKVNSTLENGVQTASSKVTQKVIRPAVIKPVSIIISIFSFLVLNLLVHFIARVVNKLIKLSFIGGLNSTLGFIIGIPKGALVALFFVALMILVVNISSNGFWIFTEAALKDSYTVKSLGKILPDVGIFSYIF